MTVAALTPSVSYTENGVTLAFAAPFRYLAADQLSVRRVVAGVETVLAFGAAWSATAGLTDAGGTVTLVASVAGATLKIRRVTPRLQQTDYVTGDSFPAETHELALDRAMLVDQEQDVVITDLALRALLAPAGETIGLLPALAQRLGKGLGFDPATGAPIAIEAPGAALAGALAAVTAAQAAQAAAEAALAATLAAYDQFDDRYLGAKAGNPALDNDGAALVTGALYYNTTVSEMRVWSGAAWGAAYVPSTGLVAKTGDTMTGALVTVASVAANAGLRLPQGTAPTAPVNGDLWVTAAGGLFLQVAAVTRQMVTRDATETLTGKTVASGIFTGTIWLNGPMSSLVTAMAALDVDCSQGNFFSKTINANSVFTFSNPPGAGKAFLFELRLTHTSGTVTWPGNVAWPNSTAPALTAGKRHRFIFETTDGGTTWDGAAQVNY